MMNVASLKRNYFLSTVTDTKWFKFKTRGLFWRTVTKRYLVVATLKYTSKEKYHVPQLTIEREPDGKIYCAIHVRPDEDITIHGLYVYRKRGPWNGEIPEETGAQQ